MKLHTQKAWERRLADNGIDYNIHLQVDSRDDEKMASTPPTLRVTTKDGIENDDETGEEKRWQLVQEENGMTRSSIDMNPIVFPLKIVHEITSSHLQKLLLRSS